MKKITVKDVFYNDDYKKYFGLMMVLEIPEDNFTFKELSILCCKNTPKKRNKNDIAHKDKSYMFNWESRLKEALNILRKLDPPLVILHRKGTKKYYSITEYGYAEREKKFIHDEINDNFPSDPIEIMNFCDSIEELLKKK